MRTLTSRSLRAATFTALLGSTALVATACGSDETTVPNGGGAGASGGSGASGGGATTDVALPVPELESVAPEKPDGVAVGDRLTLVGRNFVLPARGRLLVSFSGTFTPIVDGEEGAPLAVSFETQAEVRNPSIAVVPVGGDAPPSGFGYDVGTFRGEATVVNVARDGDRHEAVHPAGVSMPVLPSLIVEEARPTEGGCAPVVTDTVENTRLRLTTRATGLAPATPQRPIRFTYVFWKPTSNVSLADAFALADTVSTRGAKSSESVAVARDVVEEGTRSVLDPKWWQLWSDAEPFETFPVPAEGRDYESTMFIRAEDADGNRVENRYTVTVHRALDVFYDGNKTPVESYDPVSVSGCVPGGLRGTSVSYSEDRSESRERSYEIGAEVTVGAGIKDVLEIGFGFSVSGSVSSSTSIGKSLALSGDIIPGQFGVLYRQTTKLHRVGQVVQRDACGGADPLGDVTVTDWDWAPDLAITRDGRCPPFPPSNLPPGRKFQP